MDGSGHRRGEYISYSKRVVGRNVAATIICKYNTAVFTHQNTVSGKPHHHHHHHTATTVFHPPLARKLLQSTLNRLAGFWCCCCCVCGNSSKSRHQIVAKTHPPVHGGGAGRQAAPDYTIKYRLDDMSVCTGMCAYACSMNEEAPPWANRPTQ